MGLSVVEEEEYENFRVGDVWEELKEGFLMGESLGEELKDVMWLGDVCDDEPL